MIASELQGRIGAIWFLLAMFWARLLMHIFARMPYTGCWVAGSFVMGWVSSRSVWLPWSFQSGMCAVTFVYLGVLAKRYDVLGRVRRYPWIWVVAVAFCAHLVIDLLGAWALYYVPVVNTWFYPTLAKAKEQAKVEDGRPLAAPAGGGIPAAQ